MRRVAFRGKAQLRSEESAMDGIFGILAVAGGFGLALGVTALGVHFVLAMVPQKQRRAAAQASRPAGALEAPHAVESASAQ